MFRSLTFAAQLLGLSAVLSLAVKYGAPHLPDLPPTLPLVVLLISLPTLVMAGLLAWLQTHSVSTPINPGDQAPVDGEGQDQQGA